MRASCFLGSTFWPMMIFFGGIEENLSFLAASRRRFSARRDELSVSPPRPGKLVPKYEGMAKMVPCELTPTANRRSSARFPPPSLPRSLVEGEQQVLKRDNPWEKLARSIAHAKILQISFPCGEIPGGTPPDPLQRKKQKFRNRKIRKLARGQPDNPRGRTSFGEVIVAASTAGVPSERRPTSRRAGTSSRFPAGSHAHP